MLTRRFGRTNLEMPVFSCGGMRFQHKWQDTPLAEIPQTGEKSQSNLEATIRRSVELGITHIETARGYGSSERQLGVILPSLARERLIVQTKIMPTKDPAEFTAHFEESLVRLRVAHVDLLAIHGINDEQTLSQAVDNGGCLAAARVLQKRGLARHIGFSTHAPTRIILDAIRHPHDGGFDYVNLHWYWIFQKNWPAIEEATRRDMGVFIISPSDKGGKLYDPPARLAELCKPLHPLVFNALFCLARREVHTLSIGAARPSDFDLVMEALPYLEREAASPGALGAVLGPILAKLEGALAAAVPAELANPFVLPLPEWEEAPGQMNIPVMLWLRTLKKAYDMQGYGEMRYNLLGNGGHWFPGKNAADVEGLDLGATAERAGFKAEALRLLLKETHELLGKQEVKRLSQS